LQRRVCALYAFTNVEIVPSSERSSSSAAAPLPKAVKPLLESKLEKIKTVLAALIPEKKKRNVLEEAMFEDDGMGGFESEVMMQGITRHVHFLTASI
jgi:ATPase family AAA domain-containing protein 2